MVLKKQEVTIKEVTPLTFARSVKNGVFGIVMVNKLIGEGEKVEEKIDLGEFGERMIKEFADVFPENLPGGLPADRGEDNYSIPTKKRAKPFARTPYRLAPKETEVLKERIKSLIEMGHIRESTSPWGALVLFAPKKDRTLRMCIDYQGLNKLTERNEFPLPRIDELLDQLLGAKYFTTLDLDMAYHQIRIKPEDIPKTGFTCSEGHYEFTVMTFGFTNAPATFQTLMTRVFKAHLGKFIIVYLNNILIFSKTWEEHERHVRAALQLLRENKLYVKKKKCTFGATEVEYLGYVVNDEGIKTNPKKIEAMTKWLIPQGVRELRMFLGLCNFYQGFIHRYAIIASPLYHLLKDNIPWE